MTRPDAAVFYKVWIPGSRNGSKRWLGQTEISTRPFLFPNGPGFLGLGALVRFFAG